MKDETTRTRCLRAGSLLMAMASMLVARSSAGNGPDVGRALTNQGKWSVEKGIYFTDEIKVYRACLELLRSRAELSGCQLGVDASTLALNDPNVMIVLRACKVTGGSAQAGTSSLEFECHDDTGHALCVAYARGGAVASCALKGDPQRTAGKVTAIGQTSCGITRTGPGGAKTIDDPCRDELGYIQCLGSLRAGRVDRCSLHSTRDVEATHTLPMSLVAPALGGCKRAPRWIRWHGQMVSLQTTSNEIRAAYFAALKNEKAKPAAEGQKVPPPLFNPLSLTPIDAMYTCVGDAAYQACLAELRGGNVQFCSTSDDESSFARATTPSIARAILSEHCELKGGLYTCEDNDSYSTCMSLLRGDSVRGCVLRDYETTMALSATAEEARDRLRTCVSPSHSHYVCTRASEFTECMAYFRGGTVAGCSLQSFPSFNVRSATVARAKALLPDCTIAADEQSVACPAAKGDQLQTCAELVRGGVFTECKAQGSTTPFILGGNYERTFKSLRALKCSTTDTIGYHEGFVCNDDAGTNRCLAYLKGGAASACARKDAFQATLVRTGNPDDVANFVLGAGCRHSIDSKTRTEKKGAYSCDSEPLREMVCRPFERGGALLACD